MGLDRDFVLADDSGGGGGLSLAEDLAQDVPLIGFDEDGADLDDIAFVGFTEDAGASQADAVADPVRPPRQALAETARRAALAPWSAALALFQRLTGSHLKIRRLRAAVVPTIAVLVAVGIGLALHSRFASRQTERIVVAPPAPPVPSVLVASRPIPRGAILQSNDLQWRPWPPADIKQAYFRQGTRDVADLQGYVARARVAAGQPLSAGDIVAPAGHGFMAAMLKPGMRAVSVAIGPETAGSGLIMPGDEIDVLLAMPVPAFDPSGDISRNERASVETLLRNIRVLAIDQQTDGQPGSALVGQAATLEVTPKEAEIVTLANDLAVRGGMLVLALRSMRGEAPRDGAVAPSHMLDTDVSKLLTDRPVAFPVPKPLTIMRGGRVSQR